MTLFHSPPSAQGEIGSQHWLCINVNETLADLDKECKENGPKKK